MSEHRQPNELKHLPESGLGAYLMQGRQEEDGRVTLVGTEQADLRQRHRFKNLARAKWETIGADRELRGVAQSAQAGYVTPSRWYPACA